jgi:hypothetical protein
MPCSRVRQLGEVSDDTQRLRCNSQIPQDIYKGSPLSNEVLCLHEAFFYLTTYAFFFPLNLPFLTVLTNPKTSVDCFSQ